MCVCACKCMYVCVQERVSLRPIYKNILIIFVATFVDNILPLLLFPLFLSLLLWVCTYEYACINAYVYVCDTLVNNYCVHLVAHMCYVYFIYAVCGMPVSMFVFMCVCLYPNISPHLSMYLPDHMRQTLHIFNVSIRPLA